MSARRLLGIACIATFWCSGRLLGEFYPISPLSMFNESATVASRLYARDAAGAAREIVDFVDWQCAQPLQFGYAGEEPEVCARPGFSAYDDIVRDWIQSHPAGDDGEDERESLQITRRVFRIPDPMGPVETTDCPLLRCTARRRSTWTFRL